MTDLLPYIIGAVLAVLGALGLVRHGSAKERAKAAADAAKRHAATRKAIDHANDDTSDDPALLREWLRLRGGKQ